MSTGWVPIHQEWRSGPEGVELDVTYAPAVATPPALVPFSPRPSARVTIARTALLPRTARTLFLAGVVLFVIGALATSGNRLGGYAYSAATGVLELSVAMMLAAVGLVALGRRSRRGHTRGPTIAAAVTLGLASVFALTAVFGFAGGFSGRAGSPQAGSSGPEASSGTPVEARLTDYLDATWASTAPDGSVGDLQDRIVGKMVVVNVDTRELMFRGWFDAQPEQQASTAEEVRTVVLVWPIDVSVGTYTDGASGYRRDYWVRVVDFATKEVVGDAHLEGGDPPSAKSGSGDTHGSLPDLVGFLDDLRSEDPPPAATQ